jgi:hypothetical protein
MNYAQRQEPAGVLFCWKINRFRFLKMEWGGRLDLTESIPPRLRPSRNERRAGKRRRLFFQQNKLAVLDSQHGKGIQSQTAMIGG